MIIFLIVLLLNLSICAQINQNYSQTFDQIRKILKKNLNCSSTDSGYKCTAGSDFNQNVCKNNTEICPNNWGCISLHNGLLCRPHDSINFGLQHKAWHPFTRRQKRADNKDDCSEILCQNGAVCKNGQCLCLRHHRSVYCQEVVNYCVTQPCKHQTKCIPRVGGFTCECTRNRAGKYCETLVNYVVRNMIHPNFLYEPLQYAGFKYYYVLHSENLGFQPEAEVDFGDGTIVKRKHLSIYLNNAFDTLIKYFSPPLNIMSNKLEVYAFKHTYKEPKIYTVTVRAWNKYQEVYNTPYEVQVIAADNCSLEVTLHNTALNKNTPLDLYRQNSINIMSTAWSSCMQMKLQYQWVLHKVKSFDDELTNKNLYEIKANYVDLQKSNLDIPPFTLDYGNYTVVLFAEMVKPKPGIKRKLYTWLTIHRRSIIAHIQGGMKLLIYTKSMFYVDAGWSYDPNYGRHRQPPLVYLWTCIPKVPFCKGFDFLDERGSVLIVPPGALEADRKTYLFTVWVNSFEDKEEITIYSGKAEQQVVPVDSSVPFYSISCVSNCVGGRANNLYRIALRGIMIATLEAEMETFTNWVVYANPETNPNTAIDLNNTEYSENNSIIIVYEQQLEPGVTFKFLFSGYNVNTNSLLKRNVSYAEFFINTFATPGNGSCTVFPIEGYAMLTTFTVTCIGFIDPGSLMMQYEIIQFTDLEDRENSGALVGYDCTSTITNLTLSPGFRKHDYETTLYITATNINGSTMSAETNVIVFPLIYYLKDPEEVMLRFIHVGTGLNSPLNVLLSGGNYFELVQQVSSTCSTLVQFIKSEDALYLENKFIELSIEQIRDILMSYLYQVPISNVQSIKHTATALNKVMNLPLQSNILRASVVIGIDIMKKLIQKLEDRFNICDEEILQNDMDDIGMLLISIASSIFQTPTADYQVLREGDESDKTLLVRKQYIQQINPFNIDKETLANHDSSNAMNVIDRFMRLYMTFKIPNERTTLFTGPKVSLIMKKAAPEYLSMKSLSLANKVSLKPLFDRGVFHKNAFCNLEMIVMDNNPNWYESKDSAGLRFPFIRINLTNEVDGSPVDADLEIDVRPSSTLEMNVIKGSAPVRLFWQMKEKHIQVHRIIVPKGGKLLITFQPIQDDHKLKVAVKKEMRPRMSDFWYNGINIPQRAAAKARDEGMSVFVDDEATEESTFYYLGVLPHMDTLLELMKNVEEPILPHAFHYDDEKDVEYFDEQKTEEVPEHDDDDNEDGDDTNVRYIKHPKTEPETMYNNQTLPYGFVAHSVRCITWNETTKHWKSNCNVRASTTSSRVTCNCTGHSPLTVSFQKVSVKYQPYTEMKYSVKYTDNPLIPFMIVFSLILFIGLFKWAAEEDRKDRLRRTVCFLVDNYPQCQYCYLVIVYTGQKFKAATTSNVTIELEGTLATSLPHVLKDWTQDVMNRGSQDWFVLKTMKPLGEIYCLHIWTDYSGPRPSWHCNKIVIHDVQEQQVWFFIVDRWFDPINGDGSMSYTIYQSTDETIFSTSYQLKENVSREFESGMHGWLSIFFKHPYSNYTRKQRVGVAYTHMVVIMLILILLNDLPVADSPQHQMYKTGEYQWENRDLLVGIYAIILAFPIHSVLLWLFRCIKPSSQWTETRLDRSLSRFNMDLTGSEDVWIGTNPHKNRSKIQVISRPKLEHKNVSFIHDVYEPERDHKLRSRLSMQRLVREAGSEKVVPLRTPTSKVETDVTSDEPADSRDTTPSIYGQEVVAQSYCFPPVFVYIAWILWFFIALPCVYVTALYGVSYGWVMGLHYMTSFFWAIILSIVIFEPLKLLFCSVYLFFYNRREYAVEDRSDLVAALNAEYQVPANLTNHVIEKINILRKSPMYMPLTEEKIYKMKRNRVVSFLTRMIIADFLLLMLFMLLLFIMVYNVFDTLAYLHHQDIKGLLEGSESSRKSSLTDVNTQDDLVFYLNNTIIANLQQFQNENVERNTPLSPVMDGVNYLVGVVRLRQIRKSPSACKPKSLKWTARCVMNFDDQNYTEGWKIPHTRGAEPSTIKEPWLVHVPKRKFRGFLLHHNETKYPATSYVVILGRSKQESLVKLEYLTKNNWFDYLTTVVYIDFVLYNLNRHYLTLVTLMAERTEQGVYYVHNDIEVVKMHPAEVYAQLYVLLFLFVLLTWLIWFVHKESIKYSLLQPKQVFSNKWNRMKRFLLILGIVNVAIYTHKIFHFEYYIEKISHASSEEYIDFEGIAFWDDCLLILIAFMQFFVIIELCNIFRTFYRINISWTVVSNSKQTAFSFFIFLVLLIVAFTWCGYFLFGRGSYNFQSFGMAFITLCGFSHRDFKVGQFGNFWEIFFLTILYCLAFVVAIFFIFRWLIAAIMIHSYSAVRRNAHFELFQPVLSNYTKKYFDSIDSSPNRKPFKRSLYLRNTQPTMYAIGCLFADFYNKKKGKRSNKEREMAMDAIAFGVLVRKKYVQQAHSLNENYQRKEQAKALARSIIIINVLKNKLEYLNAKVDIIIRKERYSKMLKKY